MRIFGFPMFMIENWPVNDLLHNNNKRKNQKTECSVLVFKQGKGGYHAQPQVRRIRRVRARFHVRFHGHRPCRGGRGRPQEEGRAHALGVRQWQGARSRLVHRRRGVRAEHFRAAGRSQDRALEDRALRQRTTGRRRERPQHGALRDARDEAQLRLVGRPRTRCGSGDGTAQLQSSSGDRIPAASTSR